jgi:hypothetical protein
MRTYLEQIPSTDNKKVAILVTGAFPFAWGQKQTIERMKNICESKGVVICGYGSVRWISFRRKKQIKEAVDNISKYFSS